MSKGVICKKMEQDWKPVVFCKSTPKKEVSVSSSSVPKKSSESLDHSEPIVYFTSTQGKKVAALRTVKNMTQEQLAQKMCIPKKTIVDLEQGKEKYSGPLVSKLKKALGNFSW